MEEQDPHKKIWHFISRNELDLAEQTLQRALVCDPHDPQLQMDLAMILEKKGDQAGAMAVYQEAVQLDPTCDLAWARLGYAHALKGEHLSAHVCLKEAIRLQPHVPEHWDKMGKMYQLQDNDLAAACAFEKATALSANEPAYCLELAKSYAKLRDFKRAVEVLEKLPQADAAFLWLQNRLARA